MRIVFALLLVASVAAEAVAQEPTCKSPPEFVGVPTGEPPFDVKGDAVAAGTERFMNFGDHLLVSGGEGGFEAVTLWGKDACGVWLMRTSGDSYLGKKPPALRKPKYEVVKADAKGRYRVQALGQKLELEEVFPGRFKVVLKSAIRAYHGE